MTRAPQHILFDLIGDPANIEVCILSNFPPEAIANEELRPIYEYAVAYFKKSSNRGAPTPDVYRNTDHPTVEGKTMMQVLEEREIFLDEEPEESIEWVIDQLMGRYVTRQADVAVAEMLKEVADAPLEDRAALLTQHATSLVGLSMTFEPRTTRVDFRDDADTFLDAYTNRKEQGETHLGMHFGIPDIDEHTYGIHPGELAIVAAHAKAGKSFLMDWVALKEFEVGKQVGIFTLENSIAMTEGRIACLAVGADPTRWIQGKSLPDEEESIKAWVNDVLRKAPNQFQIMQPAPGDRTAESVVTKARLLDVDSLIIDQLTFLDTEDQRSARYLQVRDILHGIKTMISTGRKPIPCLLAHQVNRDGHKMAQKEGHYEMYHMAESAEVERTADWVFAMFQSEAHLALNRLLFQTLASRRAVPKHWEMFWDIAVGHIGVSSEISLA